VVLTGSPLLQKHLTFAVIYHYRKSTVQQALFMGFHLLHLPNLGIVFVY
jgi:hypothetical protein